MEYDEMELDMLGDQRTAMFVIISDTDDTFNFVVAIMYTQLFNLLCDKADDEHGGRLPYHVRILADEFANIGQIPKFDKLIATIRSREISASILENVRGLISNDKGNTIQTVLRTITGMGYKCNVSQELIENGPIKKLKEECSKMVLSAKDYGVPQNRPRIYIVLWRKDIDIETFVYPEPEKIKTSVGSILEKNVDDGYTISDKLWAGHKRRRVENAEKGNGFGYCLFSENSEYTSTISRRYYKDGSEILIEQEGKNPRKITPREAANLQGFPREFKLPESNTKAYQQFGNSVAVPVVTKVSEQIVKQILEV